jgi:hypothetical protein
MPTNQEGPEMTMNASEVTYDLVLTGARICDPATGLDRNCDLVVGGDRIAAVGCGLASTDLRRRECKRHLSRLSAASTIPVHKS